MRSWVRSFLLSNFNYEPLQLNFIYKTMIFCLNSHRSQLSISLAVQFDFKAQGNSWSWKKAKRKYQSEQWCSGMVVEPLCKRLYVRDLLLPTIVALNYTVQVPWNLIQIKWTDEHLYVMQRWRSGIVVVHIFKSLRVQFLLLAQLYLTKFLECVITD